MKIRTGSGNFIEPSSTARTVEVRARVDGGAMRVLVVEDEPKMRELLRRALAEEGYAVDVAADGLHALGLAETADFDAVVLDVMLPGLDGFGMCTRLRRRGTWAPVLMLTARDAIGDRVRGLDGGADDYLTKPFSLEELLARLRALIRRGPAERPTVLRAGDLRLDPTTRTVTRGEIEITVTGKEYALLEMLLRRAGIVLTREVLVEHCWDLATSPGIPPGFLPHAFDRFTQADQARSAAGTGLGLAITAAIARACGGTYGATNHPQGGADVWLTLPTTEYPGGRNDRAATSSP